MKNKSTDVLKSLKVGAVAFLSILPSEVKAFQDQISFFDKIGNQSMEFRASHFGTHSDGYNSSEDTIYNRPPLWSFNPAMISSVDGYELKFDSRGTNSQSKFLGSGLASVWWTSVG